MAAARRRVTTRSSPPPAPPRFLCCCSARLLAFVSSRNILGPACQGSPVLLQARARAGMPSAVISSDEIIPERPLFRSLTPWPPGLPHHASTRCVTAGAVRFARGRIVSAVSPTLSARSESHQHYLPVPRLIIILRWPTSKRTLCVVCESAAVSLRRWHRKHSSWKHIRQLHWNGQDCLLLV